MAVATKLENGSTDKYRSTIISYVQGCEFDFHSAYITENVGSVLIGTFRPVLRRNLLDAKGLDRSTDFQDRYLARWAV